MFDKTTTDVETLASVFTYLDGLRESGQVNMFGAGQYVEAVFCMEPREARKFTQAWMDTFDGESSVDERVEKALS